MASSEALAWSYLGFLFGEGRFSWVSAAFVGLVVFAVVWMIDVSLITLDRAWEEHSRDILARPAPARSRLRDVSTLGLRLSILAVSLTITAWRANREQLAAAFGVALPRSSVLQNSAALAVLRQRPENQATELAIKAFLALIFAGLLLLKLFEPYSVRLYLSEVLQQEYDRYLAGTFDYMLPPTEASTRGAVMSPQRFYAFLKGVWEPARKLEQDRAEQAALSSAAHQTLEVLEGMRGHAQRELDQAQMEAARLHAAAEDAATNLVGLHSAISTVRKDVEKIGNELVALSRNPAGLDELGRLQYRSFLADRLAKANHKLRELEESVPLETDRERKAQVAAGHAEEKVRGSATEIAERSYEIRKLRSTLSEAARAFVQAVATPGASGGPVR